MDLPNRCQRIRVVGRKLIQCGGVVRNITSKERTVQGGYQTVLDSQCDTCGQSYSLTAVILEENIRQEDETPGYDAYQIR